MYPLKIKPIYKEVIWGGQALQHMFSRELSNEKIGESWELCVHKNGISRIENGPWQHRTLADLIEQHAEQLLGKDYKGHTQFPLLIKYIDANDNLSIQVHPDDEYAQQVESEQGKTEAWYVLHADEGAEIIWGLNEGITRESFKLAVKNKKIENTLRRVSVRTGDLIFVPAGTVHALLKGIVVCEVQQNSDTTYRIYDFDRIDTNGNKRQLHIDKAMDVIDFGQQPTGDFSQTTLTCPYFNIEKWEIKSKRTDQTQGEFLVYCILKGNGTVSGNDVTVDIKPGDTILLPAALEKIYIDGDMTLLRVRGNISDFPYKD